MSSSLIRKKVCPLCKKELPLMADDGKHNFVPNSDESGKIISVCIKCKSERGLIWSKGGVGWGTGPGHKPATNVRSEGEPGAGWGTGVGYEPKGPSPPD